MTLFRNFASSKENLLMLVLFASIIALVFGCDNAADYPRESDLLGSGKVKWAESQTPDGWTSVSNEEGTTLGYSKSSGLKLIQVDGYAFKDLNRNNLLDKFEDWRLDS